MKYTLSLLFALCSLLFACRFNPNIQDKGEPFLQGIWEQDSVQYQDQLLKYTRHKFTFTCDSFYATLITTAKANQYPDSCFNGGSWAEYAKGTYVVRKDTLYFIGTFTGADFKQKTTGCYQIGRYVPVFILKTNIPEQLSFQNQHTTMVLNFKQKIICNPKPL